jgi:hypothetical protein
MAESFLDAGDIADIRAIKADALATRFALADPPVLLVLERFNATTELWDPLPAQAVVVNPDNRQPAEIGGGTSSGAGRSRVESGQIQGFAPLNIRPGDQFALNGGQGRVLSVAVAENGIVTAGYEMSRGVA